MNITICNVDILLYLFANDEVLAHFSHTHKKKKKEKEKKRKSCCTMNYYHDEVVFL